MNKSILLNIDSAINLILGVLLLLTIRFPIALPMLFGVPQIDHPFYPSIMGGIFIGIGIALWVESHRNKSEFVGLGLGGAISINLCGGITLMGWLILGQLNLPLHGKIFLWSIAIILIGISSLELFILLKPRFASIKPNGSI